MAVTAALLLLGLWAPWRQSGPTGSHVIAGVVEVGGRPATWIADEVPLRVAGGRSAVIETAGGARLELAASTAAVIRARRPAQVVELREGGGRFRVPAARGNFRVETPSGAVTAHGTEFEVNLWSTQGKGDDEMRFTNVFVLAVAVLAGVVQVDSPEQNCVLSAGSRAVFGAETGGKKAGLPSGDVLGFTGGKGNQPFALERVVPGVQGALTLTEEQNKKIEAAAQGTIHSQAVRTAMAVGKLDPNATAAQKEEARKVVAEARSTLQTQVGQVLTPEQKALVERISGEVGKVRQEVRGSMEAQFTSAKGNDAEMAKLNQQLDDRVRGTAQTRIAGLLSPQQQASFKQAAEAQIAAEKEAQKHPKGKK